MAKTSGGPPRKPSKSDREALDWLTYLKAIAADSLASPPEKQEEEEEFTGWLRRSGANLQSFLDMVTASGELTEPEDKLIRTLVGQVDPKIALLIPPNSRRAVSSSEGAEWSQTKRAVCVAAAFVGTIAVAAFSLWHWTGGEVYRTVGGERRRVILEDGSHVFLNERSEIRVSFSNDRRNIHLHGDAIFDVTHDARRPMSVSAANAEIRVLGTEFDVLQENGPTRVTVIEGSVQVEPISDGIAPLTLVAHEVAEVDGQRVVKRYSADVEKMTSWHWEELVLINQPLSAIVEKFNGNNRRQIRIADPAAGQEQISGRFKTDDPEALVRVLQDQDLHPGITMWETDDGWIVEAPKRQHL